MVIVQFGRMMASGVKVLYLIPGDEGIILIFYFFFEFFFVFVLKGKYDVFIQF